MPKGYLIANYKSIDDPDGMAKYAQVATPVLAEHGGNVIVSEIKPIVLEGGEWSSAMLVVIEFESVETAQVWYDSAGYAAARAIRQASADCDVMIVSGFEMPQPEA